MDINKRKLLGAQEVAEILNISASYAYKIIDQLNCELKDKGYLIIHGKVDSLYLLRRFFTNPDDNIDEIRKE